MDDDFAALGFPSDSTLFMDGTAWAYDKDDITTTRGAISRQSTDDSGRNVYQIDVNIAAGNSGGPLVNSNGEVVGITTYSVVNTASGHNTNYAVVIDELLSMINRDVVPYTLSSEVSGNAPAEDNTTTSAETEPATEATTQAATTEAPATTTKAPETSAPATSPANTNSDSSNGNMTVIIIAIAAVVVIAAVAVIIVVSKNKKSAAPVQQSAPAPEMSKTMPIQSGQGRGAVITGMKGIMANRSFNINGSIVLGRNSQKCNVCFPVDSKGISGVHCQIRQASGGYEILDLGSSNGTFLGSGQKLTPNVPVFIPDGTYFYLGSAEQLFQIKY